MSGLEVVAIVASLVSAFHGGAELASRYKKHRNKKRERKRQQQLYEQPEELHQEELDESQSQDQAVVQDMLYHSLEEGGDVVRRHFLEKQQALGRYSQYLRSGDERAKQELLMIVVSLQEAVIASLGRVQENLQVIVDMAHIKTLHEVTITKRYEATRSIDELRQRIEMRLPLPRLSVDSALGISISRRNSSESLARTFVTAAANLYISEPIAQRLLTVSPIPGQQNQLRRTGPSTRTLSSYRHLIPAIRAQDIDILTLAGHKIDHDDGSDSLPSTIQEISQLPTPASRTSSSLPHTPDFDPQSYLFGRASPHSFPQTPPDDSTWPAHERYSAPSTADQTSSPSSNVPEMIRMLSAPPRTVLEPDADTTSNLHPDARHPYCIGALAAQKKFNTSFTHQDLPILPGSEKLHRSLKCSACDFNASDPDDKLLQRIDFAHGVRYRFPFCARSHAPYKHPPGAFRPRYTYGCLFCTAEGKRSATHIGSDALMDHIATKHRTNLTPEVSKRTHSIVGRLAGREEGWDVNLPDVSSKSASGVVRFMLHAVTSLPT